MKTNLQQYTEHIVKVLSRFAEPGGGNWDNCNTYRHAFKLTHFIVEAIEYDTTH
jgi:hypothetical protein